MTYDGGSPHANYDWSINAVNFWKAPRPAGQQGGARRAVLQPARRAIPTRQLVAPDPANANRDCTTVNGAQQCYNGLPTIRRKTQWAMANAGGMMNWELSQDTTGSTSLVSAIYETVDGRHHAAAARRRAAAPAGSPASAGKCVDVAAASTANGTAIQLWTCNGTNAQTWTVGTRRHAARPRQVHGRHQRLAPPTARRSSSGTATAPAPRSGRPSPTARCATRSRTSAWTPPATARADGTRLQIWDCFAGANQRWVLP